jgi:hypothetical protein
VSLRLCGAVLGAACLLAAVGSQASTPVVYRVDEKSLKKSTQATTQLTFTLYSDEDCTVQTAQEMLFAGDVTIAVDKVKGVKVKGGTQPPKTAVINAVLSDMPQGRSAAPTDRFGTARDPFFPAHGAGGVLSPSQGGGFSITEARNVQIDGGPMGESSICMCPVVSDARESLVRFPSSSSSTEQIQHGHIRA